MRVNEKIHGFTVTKKEHIDELGCDVYLMQYDKNGARLLFLDREDDNKTFSIAFKTVPSDSTGVFHILEHSVLCGSRKFPLKDPFVELLKGSLNTFLNAMTFQDKTMYPVSSRNDKDFMNLMEVYLDAVFHPLAAENSFAFMQEGWHYEIDECGKLDYKGVVLNEMRGDYSSADTVADRHINEMLYPNSCYGYDSGGDPSEIVTLSYEQFKSAHKTYYHPSNSYILLDGSVDLDSALSLIDSYLSEYERADVCGEKFHIDPVGNIPLSYRSAVYEIAPNESSENKGRLVLGFPASKFDNRMRNYAIAVIFAALFSTNESQAKKEIIATGLCEDVMFSIRDGILEPSVALTFINVKDGKSKELSDAFFAIIDRISKKGINAYQLSSSINAFEFKLREKDYGTFPIGVIYAMISMESFLYSDDPVLNFRYENDLKELRKRIDTGYFEQLLSELLSEKNCRAVLNMLPSATLGAEREREQAEILEKAATEMTEEQKQNIIREQAALEEWQATPDSSEAKSSIKMLELSDISAEVRKTPIEVVETENAKVIFHDIFTSGISYTELWFDVSDIKAEDAHLWFLLNTLLTNLPTAKHSAADLQSLIKSELGSIEFSLTPICRISDSCSEPKVYFQISVSALEDKKYSIIDILDEILRSTLFEDKIAIKNILKQTVITNEESFNSSGHMTAITRAAAATSADAAVREYYAGYESHIRIKEILAEFDTRFDGLVERLKAILSDALDSNRLTVSVTGKRDLDFAISLIQLFKKEKKELCLCSEIKPLKMKKEGIVIPSRVGYAGFVFNLYSLGIVPTGSISVVRTLLGYEYLWNEIRVKGGAYGGGMIYRNNGSVGFYSYRDPTPERTLGCFLSVSRFLREFAEGGGELTKYIIGAIGDSEPLMTPRLRGAIATAKYLRGVDYEYDMRVRHEMLNTDSNELLRIADIIETAEKSGVVCVVSGKEKLESMSENLDVILEL